LAEARAAVQPLLRVVADDAECQRRPGQRLPRRRAHDGREYEHAAAVQREARRKVDDAEAELPQPVDGSFRS